jgi:hypothetical protein
MTYALVSIPNNDLSTSFNYCRRNDSVGGGKEGAVVVNRIPFEIPGTD